MIIPRVWWTAMMAILAVTGGAVGTAPAAATHRDPEMTGHLARWETGARCKSPCQLAVGSYARFRGRIDTRLDGHSVYFQYRRPSWSRWRNLRPHSEAKGAAHGIFSISESSSRRVRDGRWRVRLVVGQATGTWEVRARVERAAHFHGDRVKRVIHACCKEDAVD